MSQPLAPAPRLLNRRDAGRYLGVCPRTVSNLVLRGELREVRLLGRRLYDLSDIDRLIDRRKTGSAS
jgi:hypothetical protein